MQYAICNVLSVSPYLFCKNDERKVNYLNGAVSNRVPLLLVSIMEGAV